MNFYEAERYPSVFVAASNSVHGDRNHIANRRRWRAASSSMAGTDSGVFRIGSTACMLRGKVANERG